MAISTGSSTTHQTSVAPQSGSYMRPLAIVTTLFFMWGGITSLNDILVPHLKSIFDLSYAQVMLVQFAFFSGYFIFSLPSGKLIEMIGYKRSMVAGLLVMALGTVLFIPAAMIPSYPLFLSALLILAAGMTILQTSANPYVTVLGRPETASSRLNLTQAFNSLGTTIFPKIGGILILSTAVLAPEIMRSMSPDALHVYRVQQASSVKMPYMWLTIALVVLAVAIGLSKLPKIASLEDKPTDDPNAKSIWSHRQLVLGATAFSRMSAPK
jgi:MFS transporter, FHS family, L-fucose permease